MQLVPGLQLPCLESELRLDEVQDVTHNIKSKQLQAGAGFMLLLSRGHSEKHRAASSAFSCFSELLMETEPLAASYETFMSNRAVLLWIKFLFV